MGEFIITTDFVGGNIEVLSVENNTIKVKPQLRDTQGEWFYWAFCVKNAGGLTLTFEFADDNYIGYFGPAVSRNLCDWEWMESHERYIKFKYKFKPDENEVYFAHHMLYHPKRLTDFLAKNKISQTELCLSEENRSVPCFTIGDVDKYILLTARHHCCESVGSYVLEGFIDEFIKNPISGFSIFCVPFVDYDGVCDGDQGKNRYPYDHNRDYVSGEKALYKSVDKLREFIDLHKKNIAIALDFHSPWHKGGENDRVLFVQNSKAKIPYYDKLSKYFEQSMSPESFIYKSGNDIPPDVGWNSSKSPTFSAYINNNTDALLACTLETPYFGELDNQINQSRAVELGRCLCDAVRKIFNDIKK